MTVENRSSSRRKGQAMVRTVFGFGAAAAIVLAYPMSGAHGRAAVVVPGIATGLVGFGLSLHDRARRRREWSAAWDTYAQREISREPFGSIPDKEPFSYAGAN